MVKKYIQCFTLLFLLLLLQVSAITAQVKKMPIKTAGTLATRFVFEKNLGQWQNKVLFKGDFTGGRRVFFENDRFTFLMYNAGQVGATHELAKTKIGAENTSLIDAHAFEFRFVGAGCETVEEKTESPFYYNYFIGNNPANWASEVHAYQQLQYKNLYPGINLLVTENKGNLKYDYVVAAGADASAIKLQVNGCKATGIQDGALSLQTSVGEVLESIPLCYQIINGDTVKVACNYKLLEEQNTFGFEFPQGYNHAYELVIDPIVVAITYSGSTTINYGCTATYDNAGNIYTGSMSFGGGYPTTLGAFQTAFTASIDVAISKLNPTGTSLIYATYLGGTQVEFPQSLIMSPTNELVLLATSNSTNYPVTNGAADNSANGYFDIVVTKLNATGTALVGSTYIGGNDNDGLDAIVTETFADRYRGEVTTDNSGNIFIASVSASTNFPVTAGAFSTVLDGVEDGVVVKLNPNLTAVIWSTFIGGSLSDMATSIKIASNGEVYVSGASKSLSFPTTTGAFNTAFGGIVDGFVARFNSTASTLLNATFVGTNNKDYAFLLDLDYNNDVYIYGTSYGSMPVSAGVYSNPGSQNYLMKLSPDLSTSLFSTVLGNGNHILFTPTALMVDYCRNIYIAGFGDRSNYPITANAIQTITPQNCFQLMVLSPNAGSLIFSSPFGNNNDHIDGGTSRFDKSGRVYHAVCSCYGPYSTTPNAFGPNNLTTQCDNLVFKLDFQVGCDAYSPSATICYGSSASFTIPNIYALQSPTYIAQPGNYSSTNGQFTFTPTSSINYSLSVSGINSFNALQTNTGVIAINVLPMPVLSPTITQATCTNPSSSFSLGLSFMPNTISSYTVQWLPIPTGVISNTQLAYSGTIAAGNYQFTVTSAGGCKASASFSIDPIPSLPNFTLNGATEITCINPIVTLTANPATYNYTFTNANSFQTGSLASFSAANAGTCNVIVDALTGGCVAQKTIAITVNTITPSVTLTPAFQSINCSLTAAAAVTAVCTPTTNISNYWMSPLGGTLVLGGSLSVYAPGAPGTHTHMAVNLSNGCYSSRTFTLSALTGFPTYTVDSPQNFTLGCSSKSTAVINIINGQTTPPGGAVSYTLLPPGFSGAFTTGTLSTYTNITVPGQYTVVTRDNSTLCDTKVQLTVLQHTNAPNSNVVVPFNVLTCDKPSVLIRAQSTTNSVSYNWQYGVGPLSLPGDTIRASTLASTSASVAGIYSLSVTDISNLCVSNTVVTIQQNIFKPTVVFSASTAISCKTPTITLTNQSTSNVLSAFNPTAAVIGFLWLGPTPELPLQLSTTYLAQTPGVYTLTGKDLNNGCMNTYTAMIDDARDYPSIKQDQNFILPCGNSYVTIYPSITTETANLSYTWLPNNDAGFTSFTTAATGVTQTGSYGIVVTNTVNGCSSTSVIKVLKDSLIANFEPSGTEGFLPFAIELRNTSQLISNDSAALKGIRFYWNFANGTYSLSQIVDQVVTKYNAAGTYTVMLFATRGTCVDTVSKKIKVNLPSLLNVPNVFTPNGDNVNDMFFVEATNLVFIHIKIVDRWGHLVHELESETGNIAWDGKNQHGKNCSDGVYMYTISANGSDGETYRQNGTITLVR